MPEYECFRWSGANDYFAHCSHENLVVGGGGGFALLLDDELDGGSSSYSDTFKNRRLSSSERFRCLSVEVWSV
jgi:hypothetical protein